MFRVLAVGSIVVLALTGCGGGSTQTPPPAALSAPAAAAGATRFSVSIPLPISRASAVARRPQYVPTTTQSISMTFTPQFGSPDSAQQGLTGATPGCVTAAGLLTCTIALTLGGGNYTGDISIYDGPIISNAVSGHRIARNLNFPFTVTAGPNTVNVPLQAIPASVSMVAAPPGIVQAGSLFTFHGTSPVTTSIVATDAGGNVIAPAATGAPAESLTSSNPAIAIASLGGGQFSMTPTAFTTTSTMTATLTPSTSPGTNSGAIPVTSTFSFAAWTPRLYVARTTGSVSTFDLQGNAVATSPGTFGSIGYAEGIAYVPSAGLLFTTCGFCTAVNVYDLLGNSIAVTGAWTNANNTHGIDWNPVNNRLYVANYASNTVDEYDTAGNRLGGFSLSGPFALSINHTTGDVYVGTFLTGGGANQYTSAGTLVRTYASGSTVTGLAADSVTGDVYVSIYNGAITRYDSSGNPVSTPGGFPGASNQITSMYFETSSQMLYAATGNGTGSVVVYDSTGHTVVTTGTFAANPFGFVYVP